MDNKSISTQDEIIVRKSERIDEFTKSVIKNIPKLKMFGYTELESYNKAMNFGYSIHVISIIDNNFKNTDSIKYRANVFDKKYVKVIGGTELTSAEAMFLQCKAEGLDLSDLDTSKVTTMDFMFSECSVKELCIKHLDTSNVTSMIAMFSHFDAEKLDLKSFDTSNVRNMNAMLSLCEIDELDISSFDTSKVENMKQMFLGSKFRVLNLGDFDTSNVKNFEGMFEKSTIDKLITNNPKIIEYVVFDKDNSIKEIECNGKVLDIPKLREKFICSIMKKI